jgi:TorA maturation chaperone TorD
VGSLESIRKDPLRRQVLDTEFCELFLMSKSTSPMAWVWLPWEQLANSAKIVAKRDHWQGVLEVGLEDGPWGDVPQDHFAVLRACSPLHS